jgi:signal peptidase II
MKKPKKAFLLCLLSVLLIGGDRFSKIYAKEHLLSKGELSYFHDMLRLEYVENTGAFLSFGDTWSPAISFWAFSIIPMIFLFVLFLYALRESKHPGYWHVVPLVLVFSGGIGNIIDRIFYDRHVSDFINVGFHDLRTGIFNFADLYVTTGVIMYLYVHYKARQVVNSSGSETD